MEEGIYGVDKRRDRARDENAARSTTGRAKAIEGGYARILRMLFRRERRKDRNERREFIGVRGRESPE